MRKLTSFASLFFSLLLLSGCSGNKNSEFDGVSAQELYSKGHTYLEQGDYNNAVRYLDAIDARANNGAYNEQVLLSTAYAQYKLGEYHKALEIAERFARTYPNSPSMDYAFYLAGLSNARLGDNWIQDLFNVNRSSRAVESINNAYGNFQTVVQHFPQSQYAEQAASWLAYLKNRLAEHELSIAQFYMERKAYVAVANRVEEMLRLYPDTKPAFDALALLQQSLSAMGIHDSADKIAVLIQAQQNESFPTITKPEYPPQF